MLYLFYRLTKNPRFLFKVTPVRPRRNRASLALSEFLSALGASRGSPCSASTRYRVEPTTSSRGLLPSASRTCRAVSKLIFCGRFTIFFSAVPPSSSSSLESVRNSAGSMSGSFCVLLWRFEDVFRLSSSSLLSLSSAPSSSDESSFLDVLGFVRFRFSACCFRRLSRACRFRFVVAAYLGHRLVTCFLIPF